MYVTPKSKRLASGLLFEAVIQVVVVAGVGREDVAQRP